MPPSTSPQPPRRWVSLATFLALNAATLALGGWLTSKGRQDGWYETLRLPPFQPPGWVFSPVWITLMLLTAIATWRVYIRPASATRRPALVLYAVQLLLNVGWSYLFFYSHRPRRSLAEILLFDLILVAMIATYRRVDRAAGLLLVPYLVWLLFATAINGWIVANN